MQTIFVGKKTFAKIFFMEKKFCQQKYQNIMCLFFEKKIIT